MKTVFTLFCIIIFGARAESYSHFPSRLEIAITHARSALAQVEKFNDLSLSLDDKGRKFLKRFPLELWKSKFDSVYSVDDPQYVITNRKILTQRIFQGQVNDIESCAIVPFKEFRKKFGLTKNQKIAFNEVFCSNLSVEKLAEVIIHELGHVFDMHLSGGYHMEYFLDKLSEAVIQRLNQLQNNRDRVLKNPNLYNQVELPLFGSCELPQLVHSNFFNTYVEACTHVNGGGLVARTAFVEDSVYVAPHARVLDFAKVIGRVRLEQKSQIVGAAVVMSHRLDPKSKGVLQDLTIVEDFAFLRGTFRLSGASRVSGQAQIWGQYSRQGIEVWGDVHITDFARVFGWSRILGSVLVKDHAWVYDAATIDCQYQCELSENAEIFGESVVAKSKATKINGPDKGWRFKKLLSSDNFATLSYKSLKSKLGFSRNTEQELAKLRPLPWDFLGGGELKFRLSRADVFRGDPNVVLLSSSEHKLLQSLREYAFVLEKFIECGECWQSRLEELGFELEKSRK